MTNEEKAREIAEKEVHPIIAERCALEMAEWKDKQFKEYLEKKLAETHPYWNGYECFGAESIINEIINELFKED